MNYSISSILRWVAGVVGVSRPLPSKSTRSWTSQFLLDTPVTCNPSGKCSFVPICLGIPQAIIFSSFSLKSKESNHGIWYHFWKVQFRVGLWFDGQGSIRYDAHAMMENYLVFATGFKNLSWSSAHRLLSITWVGVWWSLGSEWKSGERDSSWLPRTGKEMDLWLRKKFEA